MAENVSDNPEKDTPDSSRVPGDSMYRVNVAGVLIGRIDFIESEDTLPVDPAKDPPPPGLRGFPLFVWCIRQEIAYNALTLFEVYIALVGATWGAFLLLPMRTFDHAGLLWYPLRTISGTDKGDYWYRNGAEITVGLFLLAVHAFHIATIANRGKGDRLRRYSVCMLFSLWLSLGFLFTIADLAVQNGYIMIITISFLLACVRAVFRKSATR